MQRLILLLVLVAAAVAGWFVWQRSQQVPPPVPAPVVQATPMPTPEPTPEPEPTPRIAAEGVLYVTRRFTAPVDGGVHAFMPGQEVKLLRADAGYFIVEENGVQGRAPKSWFTRDMDLADALRENRLAGFEALQNRLAKEREAAEKRAEEARTKAAWLGLAKPQATAESKTAPAAAPKGPLRIGSWNLEHFGNEQERPRTEADLDAIAAYIRDLKVDVLAVAEVNGRKPLEDLCRRVGPAWKCVVGTSGIVGDGPRMQVGVGFMWNDARVEMLGATEFDDLPQRSGGLPIFHRQPVSAAFRDRAGGPDFRLVAVHFKAGRETDDNRKRAAEVEALRAYLEALVAKPGEDSDIAVLGDFNHGADFEEARQFTRGGFAEYLGGRSDGTSIVHFNLQIDHIAPLGTFEEVARGSFEIHNKEGLRDREAWQKRYSDHFPVTVELRAVPDDDPKATFSSPGQRLR